MSWRRLSVLALMALAVAMPAAAEHEPLPPGDPANLILDDGGLEFFGTVPNDVLIFNRFFPEELPLELTEVQVLFPPEGVTVGEPFTVFLYEDDDGVISTGTTHRATMPGAVQFIDGVTFTIVTFDPVMFEGPGQILIAVGHDAAPGLVHSEDITTPSTESWVVDWGGTMPPPIPSTGLGFINLNWMIRGFGTVLEVPVELQSVTVE